MWRKKLILLALVTLTTAGCAAVQRNNQTTPSPTKSPLVQNVPRATPIAYTAPKSATVRTLTDYAGFKAGRHWVYEGKGNEFASYTEDLVATKGTFYQLQQNNGGVVLARVFDVRKDGLYEVYIQPNDTGKSVLGKLSASRLHKDGAKVLPYPIKKGVSWTLPDGSKARVVSTDITRTVPFGKMRHVVHIRVDSTTTTGATGSATTGTTAKSGTTQKTVGDFYYAKGVGLIERRFTVGKEVITSKLQKMTLTTK